MTPAPKRRARTAPAQPIPAATEVTTASETQRKPWKKKTPAEVVLAQIDRLREDVAKKEEEFKQAQRQLEKLEQARKIFESL
jgi:predicted patatin/cPLA2 family phospholipase